MLSLQFHTFPTCFITEDSFDDVLANIGYRAHYTQAGILRGIFDGGRKRGGCLDVVWVWVEGFMDQALSLKKEEWQRVVSTSDLVEALYPDRVRVQQEYVCAKDVSKWDWNGRVF